MPTPGNYRPSQAMSRIHWLLAGSILAMELLLGGAVGHMDTLFLGIPCLLKVVGARTTLDSRKIESGASLSYPWSCPYARFFAVDALGQVEIRPYGCDCGQNMFSKAVV